MALVIYFLIIIFFGFSILMNSNFFFFSLLSQFPIMKKYLNRMHLIWFYWFLQIGYSFGNIFILLVKQSCTQKLLIGWCVFIYCEFCWQNCKAWKLLIYHKFKFCLYRTDLLAFKYICVCVVVFRIKRLLLWQFTL